MKKIKWKYISRVNTYEGTVDGELAFCISGTLCVQDLRVAGAPAYTITDVANGKQIAFDLLNGLNVEGHKANQNKWEAESKKTVDLIAKTEKIINDIKNANKNQTSLNFE